MARRPKTEVVSDSTHPTKSGMQREATALRESFTRVSFPSADVIAETTEMLLARADVKELQARGTR